ncbi:hypothetical protein KIN20_013433 [Parelaphostrongylus tenuis]|uniref:Uncharacterized protein n=1 Tax=Parelaphostrongylus tenuis TaxID=148309 RepID=A0AAD5QNT7_PARTN|nr:hypothetical protein KIN20_013424 [Parelaphostrongylus tenuis]KAJ1355870.1 hypothetical protein KIN20_013433 [Parelaphostrongylus tenuis]
MQVIGMQGAGPTRNLNSPLQLVDRCPAGLLSSYSSRIARRPVRSAFYNENRRERNPQSAAEAISEMPEDLCGARIRGNELSTTSAGIRTAQVKAGRVRKLNKMKFKIKDKMALKKAKAAES